MPARSILPCCVNMPACMRGVRLMPSSSNSFLPCSAHIYLVDPLGNLMLRFPAQPEPKRLMKDLKLLLKASQIG
jgi:hypothetical protein